MKKLTLIATLAAALCATAAYAEEMALATVDLGGSAGASSDSGNANANADTKLNADVNAGYDGNDADDDRDSSDTSDDRGNDDVRANGSASSSSSGNVSAKADVDGDGDVDGRIERHRSDVSAFVHSLLEIADRDSGIGAEVRAVATEQERAASSTESAMAEVHAKGKVSRFFFGPDWDDLDVIRAEIAQIDGRIERLEAASNATADAEVRADLSAEIDALGDQRADLQAFVDAEEDHFSLFGWLTRFF
jgi:hypothetical protein